MGACIGKRNYKFFYLLLACLIIGNLYQICFCLYLLLYREKNKKKEIKNNNLIIIISMSLIMLYDLIFIIVFLFKLFVFHSFFCIMNVTFYENLKNKFKRIPGINPFNKNFFYNFIHIFCRFERKSFLFNKQYIPIENKIDNNINKNKNNDKFINKIQIDITNTNTKEMIFGLQSNINNNNNSNSNINFKKIILSRTSTLLSVENKNFINNKNKY